MERAVYRAYQEMMNDKIKISSQGALCQLSIVCYKGLLLQLYTATVSRIVYVYINIQYKGPPITIYCVSHVYRPSIEIS